MALWTAGLLPAQASSAATAIVGATVYDGSGGDAIADAVVVWTNGRIDAVGPRATTPVPDGARVVDAAGRFVVPGLVDTHVHYSQTGWVDGRPDSVDARESHPYEQAMADCEAHPERFHRAFLHSGVTAVFDVGGYPWTRRLGAATEDSPDAPHVTATGALLSTIDPGPILSLPDRQQFVVMTDEDTVRRAVRSHAAAGSDAIKVWFIVRRPEELDALAPLVRAAGAAAAEQGLPLVVHATSLEAARIAVGAGCHLLVHSVDDQPVDDAFVAAVVERGTFYCPTLTVYDGYQQVYAREVTDEVRTQLEVVDPSVRERVLLTASLPPDRRTNPRMLQMMAAQGARRLEVMRQNLVRLHRAGVPIVLGTDAGNPLTLHGPSVFVEMEAMQAAGLTAREVLTASTRDAARAALRGDDLGLLAPGRVADLLVLEKDPAKDIASLRSITDVCRAGVLRPRAAFLPTR